MITVFYDGKCGLCRREIEHYRRIAPPGIFQWTDITIKPGPFTRLGFSLQDGLKALHVKDSNGNMHNSVDAFITIWQQIPRWRCLGMLAGFPVINSLACILYRRFADWRFKQLGYDRCKL